MVHRILITNNGMSALKFCLSMGHRDDVVLVGIMDTMAREANYEYLTAVDQVIRTDCANPFMDIDEMLRCAALAKADMVFPGWGYLSESDEFSRRVEEQGLVFMGPTHDTLLRLGNKIECSHISDELGISSLPWSKEAVDTLAEVCHHITAIGLPVMIKAALGGGGRGIRPVRALDDAARVFDQVRSEVEGPVFVMKCLDVCRHIEVQLVGDGKACMHLGTRDCSTQRNNQKLVEEAPAVVDDPALLESMCRDARQFGERMHLRGLATAEFLYDVLGGQYYFLEVNPRLQVEHPATEMAYGGINLPDVLFRVAQGTPLDAIPAMQQNGNTMPGHHTMAVRICSENPHADFAPSTGTIRSIQWVPAGPADWGYFSIMHQGIVGGSSDSQFGHLFSTGATREQARQGLVRSLRRLAIQCTHFTSAAFMRRVLVHADFQGLRHHTKWLQSLELGDDSGGGRGDPLAGCILDAYLQARERHAAQERDRARGHSTGEGTRDAAVAVHRWHRGRSYRCSVWIHPELCRGAVEGASGRWLPFDVAWDHDRGFLWIDGRSIALRLVHATPQGLLVAVDRQCQWFAAPFDPGQLVCPFSGRVVAVHVTPGEVVASDAPLFDVEIMKMILTIRSTVEGRIQWQRFPTMGEVLAQGDHLGMVEGGGASAVPEATCDAGCTHPRPGWVPAGALPDATAAAVPRRPADRRARAEALGTTYIHDIPALFEGFRISRSIGADVDDGPGARAWLLAAGPRQLVVYATDVTHMGGSFGPREVTCFLAAIGCAREYHIPFVFFSANAGARVMANKVLTDIVHDAGEYLYIDAAAHARYGDQIVCTELGDGGRFRIDQIVGFTGCGAENLDGSAKMARQMCLAAREGLTYSHVTARSVGIGAYLCKLGHRIVQQRDASLVLTGHQAINDLLQARVYGSNQELGGVGIMGANGISQLVVDTDAEAARRIVAWARADAELPREVAPAADAVVARCPGSLFAQPDIRGVLRALCDTGTWCEYAPGYGGGTVCGRGRVGDVPLGIVAAQCRAVQQVVQVADGANREGTARAERTEPANVWTSASARKTAEALEEMRREGLPVLVLASYRGFSGGATDMFDRVLDAGAGIVETLAQDGPPVWVYVPPGGQLRGGAFVVVSPSINPGRVEMYMAPTARAGILEPVAQAKFLWKGDDSATGVKLALAQDVPERLVHHGVISGILGWSDWVRSMHQKLHEWRDAAAVVGVV